MCYTLVVSGSAYSQFAFVLLRIYYYLLVLEKGSSRCDFLCIRDVVANYLYIL